ncbi:MAG TPA: electron transfer flavoprotein subunit beta [Nitrososphaeraceae archaeon]|nr:electron transfer flavoprotein subunit beta [Nitrososphaeraceae archaeon]
MTLNIAVLVKLEPDFSEGSVSYNPDGTLNRAETKSRLGAHSAIASLAAFYTKVKYGGYISVCSMGPPMAEIALQEAQLICDADELHLYSDRLFASADTLATAEVLKQGIKKMNSGKEMDIVFSGHRASDGETGQTGPQTAWKLGFTFLGNVIDFSVDLNNRFIRAKRLIALPGFYDIVEEIQAPLPVFIAIDPLYKPTFDTISLRLTSSRYLKEAKERADSYKTYLKVLDHKKLELDPRLVGLPGSPTIVHKVEKIPKARTTRIAELIEGHDREGIINSVTKILQLIQK